jgi:hypothetical protein
MKTFGVERRNAYGNTIYAVVTLIDGHDYTIARCDNRSDANLIAHLLTSHASSLTKES